MFKFLNSLTFKNSCQRYLNLVNTPVKYFAMEIPVYAKHFESNISGKNK